jgi:hypothetical protein
LSDIAVNVKEAVRKRFTLGLWTKRRNVKLIGKKDRIGNLAERGGFEPPVEVLAPTTV